MKIQLATSLLVLLMTTNSVIAQQAKPIFMCNYYGKKINEQTVCKQFYGFKDKSEAEAIVKKIVDLSGLPQNFYLIECPQVDNCFATVIQEEAVIIYDNAFMKKANDATHNNWAEISILAHEIGHHLSMHTIKSGGSDPKKELEADAFSGFIMSRMGASLTDAQAAIKKLTSDYDTGSHPPRSQRLAAIEKGYKKAKGTYVQEVEEPIKIKKEENLAESNKNVDKSVDKPIKSRVNVDNSTNQAQEMPKIVLTSESESTVKKGGCMEGDCQEGYGVAVNRNTEETYKGMWREGKRDGKGAEFYPDGKKKYEGDYDLGKWQGNGTYYSKEGNIFVGKFNDNLLDGEQCLVYYKNGEKYIGKYVKGKRNGKGVIIHKNGSREEVTYINDVKSNDYANRFR